MMKVGVVGCGRIATTVRLPLLKKMREVEVVAVVDTNERWLHEAADRYGVDEAYTDHRQMLEKTDVDAVFVCTPPEYHFRIVVDTIEHNKHVLCEKPITTTVEDGLSLKRLLIRSRKEGSRLVVMPAHNFLFTPCFTQALHIINEGGIGKLEGIRGYAASNLGFYRAKTDFRIHARGGVIEDQLPHIAYLCHRVGGQLRRVLFVKPRCKGGSISHADVRIELGDGIPADLSAHWSSLLSGFIPSLRLNVLGDSGWIEMDLLRKPYTLTWSRGGEGKTIHMGRRFLQYLDTLRWRHPSYMNEQLHFFRCIKGLEQPQVTIDDGIELTRTLSEVMNLLERSSHSPTGKEKVAVLRVKGEDIEDAVRRSITLLGGLNIKRNSLVVIKPNVCYPKNTDGMIITDPRVLEAIIGVARERTHNIIVVESDSMSGTAEYRVKKSGVMDIIEGCGVDFLNLSEDEVDEHEVAGFTLQIPKTLQKADFVINVPKVKTHEITTITVAMKNMFGALANKKKMELHSQLTKVLVFINKVLRQDFILVDGIIGMEGLGPIHGKPVRLGLIIAGLNPVTVDSICCHIMGFNPYAVEPLLEAYKEGIGEIDIKRIQILGEKINNVKKRFTHPTPSFKNILSALKAELRLRLGR